MLEFLERKASPYVKQASQTFRKEIIRFGHYRHPNPEFWTKKDYNWQFGQKEASQVIENFKAGAVESVKFLGYHDEDEAPILGEIKDLILTDHGIDAIIDIGDEATAKRVAAGRSLAPGVSVGLDERFPKSDADSSDVFWPGAVLRHVAATPLPWISGLREWSTVQASTQFSKINFGHDDYDGTPAVRVKEMSMNRKQRRAFKALATSMNKSEEDLAAELGLELDDPDEKKDRKDPAVEKLLKSLSRVFDDDENDEDDEDADDEDDLDGGRGTRKSASRKTSSSKAKEKRMSRRRDDDDEIDVVAEARRIVQEAITPLTDGFKELSTSLAKGNEAVAEAQKAALQREAKDAVASLINAGRATPAQREHYESLYVKDKDLFEQLTGALPKTIKYNSTEEPVPAGDYEYEKPEGGKLSTVEVKTEVSRYVKDLSRMRAPAGQYDQVPAKGDN